MKYIFTSERLGFRNWDDKALETMITISGDKDVMEFFPAPATAKQTAVFVENMTKLCKEKGYCYFAVELLENGVCIGFIGLNDISYTRPFKASVDIGWRLGKSFWRKGYASEGAKACLNYGLNTLGIQEIVATAPVVNKRSISVMENLGMKRMGEFQHPRLADFPHLSLCVHYWISKKE